ncbi:MAG: NTP transferase domain-containing protein [Candidatus Heimdallarchaeota archaeon]|nr:MAG: NTP transferase domain-containing protein [Candidatus Heimdallarchaeota archaeon]
MEAIILTAGKGTRLHPLTKTTPKPLIPIAGRPLLFHILDSLEENIDRVLIVISHESKQIEEAINDKRYTFDIKWVIQQEQLGTGHAIQICKKQIDSRNTHFFMMYGDIFTTPQVIKDILKLGQLNNHTKGVFAAKDVNNPEKYGCLKIENDFLVEILEKNSTPPSNFINAGIMVLPLSIFDSLSSTPKSNRGEIEITDSINMLIQEGTQFSVYYIKEHWIDIGYPWNLLEANEIGIQQTEFTTIPSPPPAVTIEGSIKVADNVVLRPGTFIQGPVIIDENVVVGPNCFIRPGTYLGKDVRIGNGVEIKNSVILDSTILGHLSYVGDSIIGRNCNFGAGTKVANLKLEKNEIKMTIKGELLSTGLKKLGVFMGDNVNTGINVSLMPGILIGENSRIGAHTLVNQDVPPNTLYYYDPKKGLIQKPLR